MRHGTHGMATASDSMNDKGEQVIAATLRPDGTLRKERRVRAGYVSPDEVPRYVPRQIRERNDTQGSTSRPLSASSQRGSSNSIPGYSDSPPKSSSKPSKKTKKPSASNSDTQAPSSSSVDDAVDALCKLTLQKEPLEKQRVSSSGRNSSCGGGGKSSPSKSPKTGRRGAGSFKYHPNGATRESIAKKENPPPRPPPRPPPPPPKALLNGAVAVAVVEPSTSS